VGRDDDWFRNTSWNCEIEDAFYKKLARAKDKHQYLRIQASLLGSRYPEVALRLLDEYFALGDHLDAAQAHAQRAAAYLCLNQIDSAILAYEAALAREVIFPSLRTRACLELPFLIATRRLSQHYERAIALLEANKDELVFPADRFTWNCALALIRSEQGDRRSAREAAGRALAASSETRSGFRYHPTVELVSSIDASLRRRLNHLADR
jgi:tetratricopeptide (TPR) repeat protein